MAQEPTLVCFSCNEIGQPRTRAQRGACGVIAGLRGASRGGASAARAGWVVRPDRPARRRL